MSVGLNCLLSGYKIGRHVKVIERFDTLFLAGNKKVLMRILVSPFALHVSVLAGVRTAFVFYCFAAITRHLSTSTKSNHVIFLALLLFGSTRQNALVSLLPPPACLCVHLCLHVYTQHNNAIMKGGGICLMLQAQPWTAATVYNFMQCIFVWELGVRVNMPEWAFACTYIILLMSHEEAGTPSFF